MKDAVNSFAQLHDSFSSYRDSRQWIFRGHADATWELIPRAGRSPYNSVSDRQIFEVWKRRAVEYVPASSRSDWDWLSIAQHHRLATRLLDWTSNPLNAAFFAVTEHFDGDAVVHAVRFKEMINPEYTDPMNFTGFGMFRPRTVASRIRQQQGVFTVHGEPSRPLDVTSKTFEHHRIIIAADYRDELLSELAYYGINSATLFPDLDGLSAHLNWAVESNEWPRLGHELSENS